MSCSTSDLQVIQTQAAPHADIATCQRHPHAQRLAGNQRFDRRDLNAQRR